MTVYQVAGATLVLANDGSVKTGNISLADSINPINGAAGANVVRIANDSTTSVATVAAVSNTTTYQYDGVGGIGNSSGVGATFNVTVTADGYTNVTLVNGGTIYVVGESVYIDGGDLGGQSSTNDLILTADTVDDDTGALLTFSFASGTPAWPQNTTAASVYVLPNSEQFVNVNAKNNPTTVTFTSTATDGNVYITPVGITA